MKKHNNPLIEHAQRTDWVDLLATIVMFALMVSIFVVYEARMALLRHKEAPPKPNTVASLALTQSASFAFKSFVSAHTEIDYIAVVDVNLTTNTRKPIIYVLNGVASVDDRTLDPAGSELFTSDPVNNSEVAELMGGSFRCTAETRITDVRRDGGMGMTCRVPIPPYYGRIQGYIAMHSSKPLSIYQQDKLQQDAVNLAVVIAQQQR